MTKPPSPTQTTRWPSHRPPHLPFNSIAVSFPTSPAAQRLDQAGQTLHEQLRLLEASSQQPGQPLLLGGLTAAFKQYEQAVLACVPPAPVDVLSLTPMQLLAYRETDPIYKLGWVRGHKAGVAQAQRSTAPVLNAYAKHATLPSPTEPTALMQQVRRFLAQLQQRHEAGLITALSARRPV